MSHCFLMYLVKWKEFFLFFNSTSRCQLNFLITKCSIAKHNQTSIKHKKFGKFRLIRIQTQSNNNKSQGSLTKMVMTVEFISFISFSLTSMFVHRAPINTIKQNKSIKTFILVNFNWYLIMFTTEGNKKFIERKQC